MSEPIAAVVVQDEIMPMEQIRRAFGPRAPRRRRRKRLAKKITARGGMLRTRGIVQAYYKAWPAMSLWSLRVHG